MFWERKKKVHAILFNLWLPKYASGRRAKNNTKAHGVDELDCHTPHTVCIEAECELLRIKCTHCTKIYHTTGSGARCNCTCALAVRLWCLQNFSLRKVLVKSRRSKKMWFSTRFKWTRGLTGTKKTEASFARKICRKITAISLLLSIEIS